MSTDSTDRIEVPPTVPAELLAEVARPGGHVAGTGGKRYGPFAGRAELLAFARHAAVFALFAVVLLNLPAVLADPTRVRQFAEYLCYAMVALGIDIAWGHGNMLTLGQGVFFGLGAYVM